MNTRALVGPVGGAVLNRRYVVLVLLIISLLVIVVPTGAKYSYSAIDIGNNVESLPRLSTAAENVELLGQIGGHTRAVAIQGNYAYIGMGPRLVIVDISNIGQLHAVGQSAMFEAAVQDIVVSGDYVYLAAGYTGLRIIDVSDPTQPEEVGSYEPPSIRGSLLALANNHVYIDDSTGRIHIVNVSEPSSPRFISSFGVPFISRIEVVDNYAYVTTAENGLRIFDVSNPLSAIEVGSYVTPDITYTITVADNFAYVTSFSGATVVRLRIIDISDPSRPKEVGVYESLGQVYDVKVDGDYAYVVNGYGLRVIDVSNPSIPQQIGSIYIDSSWRVAVEGSHAFVASTQNGLRVVDVSEPGIPQEVDYYNVLGDVSDGAIVGGYAYLVSENGLRIVDVSNPGDLHEVASYFSGPVLSVGADGHYAYVTVRLPIGSHHFRVVDISDPSNPQEISSTTLVGWPSDTFVAGDYAYVTTSEGLYVYDISNPYMPQKVGFYGTPGHAKDVVVVGDYAYVADVYDYVYVGLRIIDISDSATPQLVGSYEVEQFAYDSAVAVIGNHALLASGYGLYVIDVSEPSMPEAVNYFETFDQHDSVVVVGNHAYVGTDGGRGLLILNISNPLAPYEAGFFTPGFTDGLSVLAVDEYIYALGNGISILQFFPPTHFSISGWIVDNRGSPVRDVTVVDNINHTAVTDIQGNYTITGILTGTYTITPSKAGYTFSPASRTISVPPNAREQDFIASETHGIDLSIDSVTPIQVIEGQDLVRGKATGIKVVVRKSGHGTASGVPVRVTVGDFSSTRFYVYEAGNMNEHHVLMNDDTVYPLNFAADESLKTLYFFSSQFTPQGSLYQVEATVDPLNLITETDEGNNTRQSTIMNVYDGLWSWPIFPELYIHYFRTDWGDNSWETFESNYSFSNGFIKAVFPVSESQFVTNRSDSFVSSTAFWRGFDNRLTDLQLAFWMQSTNVFLRLANPTADRFVSIMPAGWFGDTVNRLSPNTVGYYKTNVPDMVLAEARMPTHPTGSSIIVHELGHSYGLHRHCEDYDEDCDGKGDRIGSSATLGLWVERRIPMIDREIYSFMGAHDLDAEYWVKEEDYIYLFQNHRGPTSNTLQTDHATSRAILAAGIVSVSGDATLSDWYLLPEAHISTLVPGPYTFVYQDEMGHTLHTIPFDISFDVQGRPVESAPFAFTLPYVDGTARILVQNGGATVAQKEISANAPQVTLESPIGGEDLSGGTTIRWKGRDDDDDLLTYSLLVSADGGNSWEPIAGDITSTSYAWDLTDFPAGDAYRVKVIATDGFLIAEDSSDTTFTIIGQHALYLPFIGR